MAEPTVVALVHLGCARNLIDSELILARMAEEGCVIAGRVEEADVAVLNTCSFIGPARDESEGAIEDLLDRKRRGELSAVVVAGCMVQRYRRTLAARYPDVDLFAEISDYRELARTIRRLVGEERAVPRYLAAAGLRPAERDDARLLSTPASYAYLRISHGCDHTCGFCAIPGIRGPHRSKPIEAMVAEAEELIGAGVKELVLVAEDSTAWGRDLDRELPDLIEALADLEGDHRLRLMYAYPHRFPWRLLPLLRDHPRVIPYLDIPVQHASTAVLRRMQRSGSGDQVRRILDRILAEVPGITLRTTVLIGFPGETDEDAAELVDFVREYRIGRLGAFTYSHEEDTPAFSLTPDVSAEAARARLDAVLAVRDEVLRDAQAERIGEEVEVLVDEDHGDRLVGRPPSDAPEVDLTAEIRGAAGSAGDRIPARVVAIDEEFNLICEPSGSQ